LLTVHNAIKSLLGLAAFFAAAAYGVLAIPSPPYDFSRDAIVIAACCIAIVGVLWAADEKTPPRGRIASGISLVVIAVLGAVFFVAWVKEREQRDLEKFAFENLSTISDGELKSRASELARELKDFEKETQLAEPSLEIPDSRNLTEDQRREQWRESDQRLTMHTQKTNIEFRRLYLPRASSLVAEMRARIPGQTEPPLAARPGLAGMMAGVRPASALADYILDLAQKLP
jgi:hypothetical protein